MSVYVCTTCSSWFDTTEELKVHKKKKECLKVVQERMAKKKSLRAQQDAERKAKISGTPGVVAKKEPTEDAKVITTTAPKEEIETKVDSADAEITSTSEEVTNEDNSEPAFDTNGFKDYLVENCDIKVQKVSRMKEGKLKETFEEFLPAFLELADNTAE